MARSTTTTTKRTTRTGWLGYDIKRERENEEGRQGLRDSGLKSFSLDRRQDRRGRALVALLRFPGHFSERREINPLAGAEAWVRATERGRSSALENASPFSRRIALCNAKREHPVIDLVTTTLRRLRRKERALQDPGDSTVMVDVFARHVFRIFPVG